MLFGLLLMHGISAPASAGCSSMTSMTSTQDATTVTAGTIFDAAAPSPTMSAQLCTPVLLRSGNHDWLTSTVVIVGLPLGATGPGLCRRAPSGIPTRAAAAFSAVHLSDLSRR